MARRRLTAIAGALGLLAWLATSGVTAQADTSPGPDLTYYSLLATYSWSNHDTCYANSGTVTHTSGGPCTITQTPTGNRNIAVCVQSSSAPGASQECDITQTNDTKNNYALVIQRIQQSACALTTPCQTGTQRASIGQANPGSSGSNFAGVFQTINQSIGEREDDPTQTNSQSLKTLTGATPGLEQTSGTGSNFAAVGQTSRQSQTGGASQDQTATQFAGFTESGLGINQMTGAPGGNAAVLGQVQKQDLQTAASPSAQTQHAFQDGDITQDDGAASKNFASGNQFQDQQEQGVSTTTQHQFGDPKCCSLQNGGQFFINQVTNQFGNHILLADQHENILANCDSRPNGNCDAHQRATRNGVTTPNSCTGTSFCHAGIVCAAEGTTCTTFSTGPPTIGLLIARSRLA